MWFLEKILDGIFITFSIEILFHIFYIFCKKLKKYRKKKLKKEKLEAKKKSLQMLEAKRNSLQIKNDDEKIIIKPRKKIKWFFITWKELEEGLFKFFKILKKNKNKIFFWIISTFLLTCLLTCLIALLMFFFAKSIPSLAKNQMLSLLWLSVPLSMMSGVVLCYLMWILKGFPGFIKDIKKLKKYLKKKLKKYLKNKKLKKLKNKKN